MSSVWLVLTSQSMISYKLCTIKFHSSVPNVNKPVSWLDAMLGELTSGSSSWLESQFGIWPIECYHLTLSPNTVTVSALNRCRNLSIYLSSIYLSSLNPQPVVSLLYCRSSSSLITNLGGALRPVQSWRWQDPAADRPPWYPCRPRYSKSCKSHKWKRSNTGHTGFGQTSCMRDSPVENNISGR